MASPDACVSCPLADKEPEEPPSEMLQHLIFIDSLQQAGAQFRLSDLTVDEWEGLLLLKRKRDQKAMRDLKQK